MAAVVAIDRSDAKVTVQRVQLSACTVHGEWIELSRDGLDQRKRSWPRYWLVEPGRYTNRR